MHAWFRCPTAGRASRRRPRLGGAAERGAGVQGLAKRVSVSARAPKPSLHMKASGDRGMVGQALDACGTLGHPLGVCLSEPEGACGRLG